MFLPLTVALCIGCRRRARAPLPGPYQSPNRAGPASALWSMSPPGAVYLTLAGIGFDKGARSSGFAQQNSFPSPLQVKRVRSNLERKRAREGAEPRADA